MFRDWESFLIEFVSREIAPVGGGGQTIVWPCFEQWLGQHLPLKKDKVLHAVRAIRDGKLNDPRFGSRMRGKGVIAEHIGQMFEVSCRRFGLSTDGPELSAAAFRIPEETQLGLRLVFGTESAQTRGNANFH